MTGGRWRRIVLVDVLAEHILELRGRARPCLAVEVAGVLAAAAPLGMPSGKVGHHPGWKPLQGSAATMSQAGLQARAGSPDPLRGTCKSPSGFHRRDCNEHPLPSASKCVRGRVCRGSRNPGTLDSGYLLLFFRCGRRARKRDVRCGGHAWAGEFLGSHS